VLHFTWWAWKLYSLSLPLLLYHAADDIWIWLLEKPDNGDELGTKVLQRANLPEDTIPSWTVQLSESIWMQYAASDREHSSKPLHRWLLLFGEPVQLILGESSRVKNLKVEYSYEPNAVNYTITKLPSIRCSARKFGKCRSISNCMVLEAHSVIKRYMVRRVPSTVKLNVVEPCSRCHVILL
jgi:hypothetical protein